MTTMISADCPRLIEVALPIREISAESVRQKSAQRGHISTLHLWWARRPLAASRAIVFASLVPDPDDHRCPEEFRRLVEKHLKTDVPPVLQKCQHKKGQIHDPDPYRPYPGVPDTLRNRLMAFIGKWSLEWLAFEAGRSDKAPAPADMLDQRSLIKWETGDPENVQGSIILSIAQELVRGANSGVAPTVLDPFAGGGSIPLEAGRLGAQPIANDYNPVAYLVLRATCEFPQKYGQPGKRTMICEEFGKKVEHHTDIPNVLVHDLEKWATWILDRARTKIGHLYPPGADGLSVVAYLWARTTPCSNPSCRGEIPLLPNLLICDKSGKRMALTMKVDKTNKTVTFGITRNEEIVHTNGTTVSRGARCPFCGQSTRVDDIKQGSFNGQLGQRMIAIIVEGPDGKDYRAVEESDIQAFKQAEQMLDPFDVPNEPMPNSPDLVSGRGWNFKTWGSLFGPRQLLAMQVFVSCLHEALHMISLDISDEEYCKAIGIYLGLWVSRNAMRMTSVGRWNLSEETFATPFATQAIPMKWDYPEANPFAVGGGGFGYQLSLMLYVLRRENNRSTYSRVLNGDGAALQVEPHSVDMVVTDPPYFDAIAYADLSDFFYVWLKRSVGDVVPEVFTSALTLKGDEATAIRYRHNGDGQAANAHFRRKLAQVLATSRGTLKPDGLLVVMFAHQSSEAWAALIGALFEAGLSIDATWPIDTERKNRALALGTSALASSITVACRPRMIGSATSLRSVRKEIEQVVAEAVKRFWSYGFRGADLIVACYGPTVGVFGKYERVERADGTPVEVPELLEMARAAARDAIAGEFKGDNLSTLYYVWANLYGAGGQAWDDARLVVQLGGDAENAMEVARHQGIFVVEGPECRLALLADRAGRRGLGMDASPLLIDALHRAMLYWKQENRAGLVRYLAERDLLADGPFWKLAQALFDVMPRDTEDWKLTSALLSERETLRLEAKQAASVNSDGQLRMFE